MQELSDYLDQTVDPELRANLQRHVQECPNCWVVVDTCQKTIRVIKDHQPQDLPAGLQERLMAAVQKKMRAAGQPDC